MAQMSVRQQHEWKAATTWGIAQAQKKPWLTENFDEELLVLFAETVGVYGLSVVEDNPDGFFQHAAEYDHASTTISYVPDWDTNSASWETVLHELAHAVQFNADPNTPVEDCHGADFISIFAYVIAEAEKEIA